MGGATVGEVVAVDGGEDHVAEPPPLERFGGVFGFVRVEGWGRARGFDGAEAAAARAGVAHEHNGGCGSRFGGATPAVADVGAAGFFADGMEV